MKKKGRLLEVKKYSADEMEAIVQARVEAAVAEEKKRAEASLLSCSRSAARDLQEEREHHRSEIIRRQEFHDEELAAAKKALVSREAEHDRYLIDRRKAEDEMQHEADARVKKAEAAAAQAVKKEHDAFFPKMHDFWKARYYTRITNCSSHQIPESICSLCGGSGIIDTRNVVAKGVPEFVKVGRLNICGCEAGFVEAKKAAKPERAYVMAMVSEEYLRARALQDAEKQKKAEEEAFRKAEDLREAGYLVVPPNECAVGGGAG